MVGVEVVVVMVVFVEIMIQMTANLMRMIGVVVND